VLWDGHNGDTDKFGPQAVILPMLIGQSIAKETVAKATGWVTVRVMVSSYKSLCFAHGDRMYFVVGWSDGFASRAVAGAAIAPSLTSKGKRYL
jgi:hypothetical protein